jgi:hypothetical protein
MELDPDIHIVMHSVLSLKTGCDNVDDIVVKTTESNSFLENLAQVFDKLRATCTKLNPEKCVFGVSAGKVLGFLVSHRGIEANPDHQASLGVRTMVRTPNSRS